MSTKTELLKYLDDNFGTYVSGEKLAKELGVSRAAVNKAARSLRQSGYKIYSRTSQGYCLRDKVDILSEASVETLLNSKCKVKIFDSIASTNNYAKTLDVSGGPVAIIANTQTAGMGKFGRNENAAKDSALSLSVAFSPDLDLAKSPFITIVTAIAVCHAIEEVCGASPKIKWVNDIYLKGLQVCEIISEAQMHLETGKIHSLILGVNLNCFPGSVAFDQKENAGAIGEETNSFSRTKLAAAIINNILEMLPRISEQNFIAEYRRRCFVIGKKILVHSVSGDRPVKARVIDIDDKGGLVVEYMEGLKMRDMETLTSGEITLREED